MANIRQKANNVRQPRIASFYHSFQSGDKAASLSRHVVWRSQSSATKRMTTAEVTPVTLLRAIRRLHIRYPRK
jgi:hypothetical protein